MSVYVSPCICLRLFSYTLREHADNIYQYVLIFISLDLVWVPIKNVGQKNRIFRDEMLGLKTIPLAQVVSCLFVFSIYFLNSFFYHVGFESTFWPRSCFLPVDWKWYRYSSWSLTFFGSCCFKFFHSYRIKIPCSHRLGED